MPLSFYRLGDENIMSSSIKTVFCLHDLSLGGGCSLSEIIPIISAAGHRCIPMPTALFSFHTAMGSPHKLDTGDFVSHSVSAMAGQGITPDYLYSGYLASIDAAAPVRLCFDLFPNAVKVHDPAFGDGGRLYSGITEDIIDCHRHLSADSTLVLPNITEALILCSMDPALTLTEGIFKELCSVLVREFSPAIIKGVEIKGQHFNALVNHRQTVRINYSPLPAAYPGTGDLFGALVVSGLAHGLSPEKCIEKAHNIVSEALACSMLSGHPKNNGVDLSFAIKEVVLQNEKQ